MIIQKHVEKSPRSHSTFRTLITAMSHSNIPKMDFGIVARTIDTYVQSEYLTCYSIGYLTGFIIVTPVNENGQMASSKYMS